MDTKLFEELHIIMYYKKDKDKEEYQKLIKDIYDYLLEEEEILQERVLDSDFDFDIKELIVQFVNPENTSNGAENIIEGIRPIRINKEIQEALETLKKYNTPEYECLLDNNFYNPFEDRKPYQSFTNKNFEMQYNIEFIEKMQRIGIPKYKSQLIIKNLIEIINL